MDVRDLTGRVGVVTGAGSGIGRATALAIATRGADVAICDIDEGGLKETADRVRGIGRKAEIARVDVADAAAVQAFADQTYEAYGRADLVVNNAGIGLGGEFQHVPLEEWNTIVGINLLGVVHGAKAFVDRMIEANEQDRSREAHIVNIASMAGYTAVSGMSAYNATKFAVIGLSEAMAQDLKPHRIGVTAICPGMINTPIVRSSRMYGPNATEENLEEGVRMFERRNYTPERVAKGILNAVQRGRIVAPVSPEAWAGYYAKRWFPGVLRWLSSRGRAVTGLGD